MADEKKTATIKLYRDNVPRITITYKNKKDLFKQFQKKIKQLNFPVDEIYWSDWDNDRSLVKTADDLFAAVENNSTVRMYVHSKTSNHAIVSCLSSDEEEEDQQKEESEKKKELRNRSPSPARGRGRSRSEPRHRSRSHPKPCYEHVPWNFDPWNFGMDPRYGFGPMPFYCDPRAYERKSRRSEKKAHQCCCQDMCKDFANL